MLPASLEVLEVYYDNLAQGFFPPRDNTFPSWVLDIAQNKVALPALREVVIHTPESVRRFWDSQTDLEGWDPSRDGSVEIWEQPQALRRAYEEAQIRLTVYCNTPLLGPEAEMIDW